MKKIIAVLSIFILLFATGCGATVSELNVDNTKSIIVDKFVTKYYNITNSL